MEVRFIPDGAGTKVELEHRYIERMGEGAETARAAVDAPNGWSGILEEFRKVAEGSGALVQRLLRRRSSTASESTVKRSRPRRCPSAVAKSTRHSPAIGLRLIV